MHELTVRERQVLAGVLDGLTDAQIADRLYVSPRTVETLVRHLMTKLGAASRAQLTSPGS